MRRVSRLVVVVLVLCAPVVGALGIDQGASTTRQDIAEGRTTAENQEFDSTTFVVTTYENGSATFAIRYERRLANQSEVDQFEAFAERFENESTDLYDGFRSRARSLVATGRNATGREMTATGFSRDARVQERFNTLGVVEMSFTWTGFAPVRDDGRVVVADVFESGIYLGPNQALVFRHGPNLQFQSVDPEGSPSGETLAESDSVTWSGERDFSDNRPRVAYVPASANETTTTTSGGDGGAGDGGDGTSDGGDATTGTDDGVASGDGLGMWPMVALALVAVLVAAFAYREYGGGLVTTDEDHATGGAAATAESTDETASAGGAAATASTTTPDEPAVPDEELLTDEDRVLSLLDEHGGRMRQVNIVEETGWSKSKVSMLLSDMEDEGTISKLRVGRENIVSLDGHEPDVAGSPFDDDGQDA